MVKHLKTPKFSQPDGWHSRVMRPGRNKSGFTEETNRPALLEKEKLKMLKREVRIEERRLAAATIAGASVQTGLHEIGVDSRKRMLVQPFRGAILR
jgi:hypothetical protein